MHEPDAEVRAHSYAEDLRWVETLSRDMRPRKNGLPFQGTWSFEERSMKISWREMRALHLVLDNLSLSPPEKQES